MTHFHIFRGIPFVLVHLFVVTFFIVPPTPKLVAIGLFLYVVRTLGITLGYHRYFSHRSFQTSRFFQFCLALLGSTAMQRGVLWWAALHRCHHRDADTLDDVYSPTHKGFWWGYLMWAGEPQHQHTRWQVVSDFVNYPELRWLNEYHWVPSTLLGVGMFVVGGWPLFIWGFILSSILTMHTSCWINTFAHMYGARSYDVFDRSRNNWLLGIFILGEGWHNNHHFDPGTPRLGRQWWQLDIGFYILKVLEVLGLVWSLRPMRTEPSKLGKPQEVRVEL